MIDIETYRHGKNGKVRIYIRKAYKKSRHKKNAKRAMFYSMIFPQVQKGQ